MNWQGMLPADPTGRNSTSRSVPLVAGPADGRGRATNHAGSRQPPPPALVAAAEQDYHAMRNKLTGLVRVVQGLLAEGFTEIDAVTEVWLTLRAGDDLAAAFLGAAAVVRLAMTDQSVIDSASSSSQVSMVAHGLDGHD